MKGKFRNDQDAAKPNMKLAGTAIAAINSVTRIAARASGSSKVSKNFGQPLLMASTNTTMSGANRNNARKTTVTLMIAQRVTGDPRLRPGGKAAILLAKRQRVQTCPNLRRLHA